MPTPLAESSTTWTANLNALLVAKDSFVRAAAAIYLALENETTGMPALREAAQLSGDAGAWAALALARRGAGGPRPRRI